jgi:hypothetical protein
MVPSGSSHKYLYGEQRRESVLRDTTILGGAFAVTGRLDASSYDQAGRIKPSARFDVYSIANNYVAPLNPIHQNYRIKQQNKMLQSEGIFAMDANGTSILDAHPVHWGQNEASPIYKNGVEMTYTVQANGGAGIVYGGQTFQPLRFAVGLAIRNVTEGSTTMRRMVALFVAGRHQFEGTIFYHHYMLGWADPPYTAFTCSQLIDLPYPFYDRQDSRNAQFPSHDRVIFHSNESGTRMSAVACGNGADFYYALDNLTGSGTPIRTQVVHLDIAADGKSCTVTKEAVQWVPDFSGVVDDPWNGEGEPIPYGYTATMQSPQFTYAICYSGDTEKRCTVAISRTAVVSRVVSGWAATETTDVTSTGTFRLGATTVSSYARTGTSSRREWDHDMALLLGIDPVNDIIYHERNTGNGRSGGISGQDGFYYEQTDGYQVRINSTTIYSGSGTIAWPDTNAVVDTAKEIGIGVKWGLLGFDAVNGIWDACAALMPIRAEGVGLYAGAFWHRSWFAKDAYGNTLFVCYIPRVILPGDPDSSGGINFSYAGFPNEWHGQMHMDQFPDGIQIARLIRNDGTVVDLADIFDVPGTHIGWKFAGVF